MNVASQGFGVVTRRIYIPLCLALKGIAKTSFAKTVEIYRSAQIVNFEHVTRTSARVASAIDPSARGVSITNVMENVTREFAEIAILKTLK